MELRLLGRCVDGIRAASAERDRERASSPGKGRCGRITPTRRGVHHAGGNGARLESVRRLNPSADHMGADGPTRGMQLPYRAAAQEALARWREAQSRVERHTPDSPEWRQAQVDAELAKAQYQEAFDNAHRLHLPEPPNFDDAIDADTKTDMSAVGDDGGVYGG
jgi:hypothetical protein